MAAAELPDGFIDTALRSVPGGGSMPTAPESLFDDAAVDRILCRVPCPAGLFERILAADRQPGRIDLHAVLATPADRRRPDLERAGRWSGSRRPWWSGHAGRRVIGLVTRGAMDGASVAAVLLVGAFVFVGGAVTSRRLSGPTPTSSPRSVAEGSRPSEAATPRTGAMTGGGLRTREPGEAVGVHDPAVLIPGEPFPDEPTEVGRGPARTDGLLVQAESDSGDAALSVEPSVEGDGYGEVRGAPATYPSAPATYPSAPATYPGRSSNRGGMGVASLPPPTRRRLPSERGYDIGFELAHGVAPFVDPAVAGLLAVDVPPLSLRTESFDALPDSLASRSGGRPGFFKAIEKLRVEDVLAALPAASDSREIGLRLTGFPSFRERTPSRFLEVCVTAPKRQDAAGSSDDVIIVMDASASPGADEAWPAMVRGLRDAMKSSDHRRKVSVVLFADHGVVAARNATPDTVENLCDRLDRFRPTGSGDLHASLAVAHRLRDEVPSESPNRRWVVLAHSGSVDRAERDGDELLAAWRGSNAAMLGLHGGPVEVVRINAAAGLSPGAGVATEASLIEGVPLDASLIRRRVSEAIIGSSMVALSSCRLEVFFDPSTVAAYRLVGHRRNVTDLASPPAVTIDLFAGESVRVVYEVLLKEKQGAAARASLTYRSPGNGREQRIGAAISSTELSVDPPADDAVGWAPWLAAGLAEIATGSPHLESSSLALERMRRVVDRWPAGMAVDAATERLLTLVRVAIGRNLGAVDRSARPARQSIDQFDAKN